MGFSSKLAEVFVEVGAHDQTTSDLNRVRGRLTEWAGRATKTLTLPITIASSIAGASLTRILLDATRAAGDLNETLSKTKVVFGGATDQVLRFADQMAEKFGSSKREILDAAAAFGQVFQGAGFSEPDAARMAIQMARLADDASSIYNKSLGESLQKIRSGLLGESEPIRDFSVFLDEAAVKAKAATMGLVGELDTHAKVAARAQIIIEGLAKAEGDHERTLGSLANQQRKVEGEWENFKTKLGESLIEPTQSFIKLLEELGETLSGTATAGIKALGDEVHAWIEGIRRQLEGGGKEEPHDTFSMGSRAANEDRIRNIMIARRLWGWAGLGHLYEDEKQKLEQELVDSDVKRMLKEQGIDTGPISQEEILKRFGPGALTGEAEKAQAIVDAQQAQQKASDAFLAGMKESGKGFLEYAHWFYSTSDQRAQEMVDSSIRVRQEREALGDTTRMLLSQAFGNTAFGQLGQLMAGIPGGRLMQEARDQLDRWRPFQAQKFAGVGAAMDQLQLDVLNHDQDLPKQQVEQLKKSVEIADKQLDKLGEIASKLGRRVTAVVRGPE